MAFPQDAMLLGRTPYGRLPPLAINSEFFPAANPLLGVHVLEFAGLEDFAAILTFHKLGIFVATDNLNAEMLARLLRDCDGRRRRRLWTHKSGSAPETAPVRRDRLAGFRSF